MMIQGAADEPDRSDFAKVRLLELCRDRLTRRAQRMLERFPAVKKFNDTGDVVQEACLRLWKSLDAVHPENPEQFLRLAGQEIHQVLLDLDRHCSDHASSQPPGAPTGFRR